VHAHAPTRRRVASLPAPAFGTKLTGSHVAVQMMNVEGLTRENVASHLQKFRLYTRRLNDAAGGRRGGAEEDGDDDGDDEAPAGGASGGAP